jgi:nitrite reductase/ring-hydroxylating ferredoxin subunit
LLYKVAETVDIPAGEMRQFSSGEIEFLIININGQFLGLAARCTHAGAPLVEGDLNGEVLTCPWHGSQFRVTSGAIIRGPAQEGLKVYQVVVEERSLFVQL